MADEPEYESHAPRPVGSQDFEPMFLDQNLFDRQSSAWTVFEQQLLELVMNSPSARGLRFSQRLSIVECMREAGQMMLNQIEKGK